MRFFSCYGTPPMDPPAQEHSKSDMRRLVSPRRRGRRSLAPPDWKPSLHAIAEDNVAAPARPKPPEQIPRAKRTSRRCAPSHDNYSREHIQMMVVPAFAPTPFMF